MLLDTSGLFCYLHVREADHIEAVRLMANSPIRLTHNYVLAELVALAVVRGIPREPLLNFLTDVERDAAIDLVFVDRNLHSTAVDLLRRRPDKLWSLCDAVSFVLMAEHGIREALTTDHHFEQAGFVRLLHP
jgi:predicted nucleic acid-binding protein